MALSLGDAACARYTRNSGLVNCKPECRDARSRLACPIGSEVTQATIGTTICVSGWIATVRPSPSFTNGLKRWCRSALVSIRPTLPYELDHFVSAHPRRTPALAGQPLAALDRNVERNVKDRLERRLNVIVCAGQLSLRSARGDPEGVEDAYRKLVGAMPRGLEDDEEEVVD
jgi:hypothetical protein